MPSRDDLVLAQCVNVHLGLERTIWGDAMNMNFQRPHILGLEQPRHDTIAPWPASIGEPQQFRFRLRHIFWALLGAAAAYALATASLAVLLTVVGIFVLLIGIATAVCIHAQNNIWF